MMGLQAFWPRSNSKKYIHFFEGVTASMWLSGKPAVCRA